MQYSRLVVSPRVTRMPTCRQQSLCQSVPRLEKALELGLNPTLRQQAEALFKKPSSRRCRKSAGLELPL